MLTRYSRLARLRIYLTGLLIFVTCLGFSQVRINEVLASNLTVNYDNAFNFESWVEIYNPDPIDVNLKGYYLSDEKNNLKKWKVPIDTVLNSGSYKIIWCNAINKKLNTSFRIDPRGTGMYLSNPLGEIIDSITISEQYSNISFGRISNGNIWGYFLIPTPAALNGSNSIFGRISAPVFSKPSGRYDSTVTLELSTRIRGTQIRYTVDGSEPTNLSELYTSPVSIEKTTVVKAKAFLSGCIPSITVAKTYFINEHTFGLPVVSVSTNPSFLYGDTLGIYVEGTNGINGNCSGGIPRNWNQDWNRACIAQLFDKSGNELFSQGFNASLTGGCTRNLPLKSISLAAKWKFGKGYIDYPLFRSKSLPKYDSFRLRNSGNDFLYSMMRDGMIQSLLIGKMDIEYQAYEPAIAYFNGKYMGIMNIREDIDGNYIKNNCNISTDSIDLLENNATVLEGSSTGYKTFINNLKTMDVSKKEAFDYIDANIDVNEYINYLTAEIFIGNYDWPGNNVKFWRHKRAGSKWRWIIYDTDYGFNLRSSFASTTYRSLHVLTDSTTTVTHPNPQWSTLLFRRLIKNPVFRERFIQSFSTSLSTVFKPSYVHKCIDSISGPIASEIVFHKQLYGGADWTKELKKLHDFADQRYNFIIPYFQEFFTIYNKAKLTVAGEVNTGCHIVINKMNVAPKDTIQLYYNLPLEIRAEPSSGYQFKRWKIKSTAIMRDYIVKRGDSWKYYDKGGNLDPGWTKNTYDDSGWTSANSELGYGDGDEKTIISYGPDSVNKYVTSWFRKTLVINDTSKITNLVYNILYDDGAVVYVNGTEVGRFNMPAGTISSTTLAKSNAAEGVFIKGSINPKLLVPGENIIAVEIHQYEAASKDLSFNMEMEMTRYFGEKSFFSDSQVYSDTIKGDMSFEAEFEPVDRITNIHINEISALSSKYLDEYKEADDWFELYNSSNDSVELIDLYLTDDFKHPCKYRIKGYNKNSLKISPQGYLVFWADNDCYQGINHCSFKLSANSEKLGIFQLVGNDTVCLDSIIYGQQKMLTSYCRFPDGANHYIFTNVLTPSGSNKESIISPLNIENAQNATFGVYPNPVSNYIMLRGAFTNSLYSIFNMQGMKVSFGLVNELNTIDCSDLANGVYVLKIYDKEKECSAKFIKQ